MYCLGFRVMSEVDAVPVGIVPGPSFGKETEPQEHRTVTEPQGRLPALPGTLFYPLPLPIRPDMPSRVFDMS